MPKTQEELAKRATRAVLGYAFFRIESALTIGMTILLAFFLPHPFTWWQWWHWATIGSAFELGIVYTSMADERTGRKVAAAILREQYDPREIKTEKYRKKLNQAIEYRDQIEQTIATTPMGLLQTHLRNSSSGIADWIGGIYTIAQRLDAYTRDELLQRDTHEIEATVQRLRRQQGSETDPAVKGQIAATLDANRAHWKNLRALQNSMEEAEFKLDETIAALGTVYSQFQLVRAQKLSASQAKDLTNDIQAQVQRLQDILDSMSRVYNTTPDK
jgi:hypothetical protein